MIEAAAAFLWVCSITAGGGQYCRAYPQPSLAYCGEALSQARIETAQGGDAEASVAAFCTPGQDYIWTDTGAKPHLSTEGKPE